jgi:hypothetical protein
MENSGSNMYPELKDILERLNSLENRLSAIENDQKTNTQNIQSIADTRAFKSEPDEELKINLNLNISESKVGEYGLAWLGNFVLLFGIIFLTEYISKKGFGLISSLTGFASVAGIFMLSFKIRESLKHMSLMFEIIGYLLIYYFTLRLHFLTGNPLIGNEILAVSLLVIVTTVQFYMAVRKKSELFSVIAMIFAVFTAMVSNNTHITLTLCTIAAAVSMLLFFKFNLSRQVRFSVVLIYFALLIWIFNNPMMTHKFGLIKAHDFGYIYIFIIAFIFSLTALYQSKDKISPDFVVSVVVMNGIGFSLLLFLMVITFFAKDYAWLFTTIFIFAFAYSVFMKLKTDWKNIRALYALYSFSALSIVVYGFLGFPAAFMLLAFESLLVVSMALWFRSKFIVFMNLLMFIGLLITYKAVGESLNSVNFSFAIVSLVTARILHLQSERLGIKTDFLRNIYMIIGFIMMLYALHKSVPVGFVTISWTALALVYFGLSILLKNIKYRWMSIFTFAASAFYLFIVDFQKIDMVFRVLAFLVLAIISIGISIYYTKRQKSNKDDLV